MVANVKVHLLYLIELDKGKCVGKFGEKILPFLDSSVG